MLYACMKLSVSAITPCHFLDYNIKAVSKQLSLCELLLPVISLYQVFATSMSKTYQMYA